MLRQFSGVIRALRIDFPPTLPTRIADTASLSSQIFKRHFSKIHEDFFPTYVLRKKDSLSPHLIGKTTYIIMRKFVILTRVGLLKITNFRIIIKGLSVVPDNLQRTSLSKSTF